MTRIVWTSKRNKLIRPQKRSKKENYNNTEIKTHVQARNQQALDSFGLEASPRISGERERTRENLNHIKRGKNGRLKYQ